MVVEEPQETDELDVDSRVRHRCEDERQGAPLVGRQHGEHGRAAERGIRQQRLGHREGIEVERVERVPVLARDVDVSTPRRCPEHDGDLVAERLRDDQLSLRVGAHAAEFAPDGEGRLPRDVGGAQIEMVSGDEQRHVAIDPAHALDRQLAGGRRRAARRSRHLDRQAAHRAPVLDARLCQRRGRRPDQVARCPDDDPPDGFGQRGRRRAVDLDARGPEIAVERSPNGEGLAGLDERRKAERGVARRARRPSGATPARARCPVGRAA